MPKLLHLLLPGLLFFTINDLMGQGTPIAKDKGKFLGNIYSQSQLTNFNQYWNQVTPENAGKWGSVEATRDIMNWTELDAAYKLAKDNNFPFKMHVLIWGNQQPTWIETLPANEQLEEIKEWFAAVAERYSALDFIEVVNEPINDPPNKTGSGGGNYTVALGGTGTTQYDWILTSFRLARQYFPNAKLMINEYNLLNNASNTGKYSQIIDLLKTENLIDAIGIQGHAFSTKGTAATIINNNLGVLAAKELPIYITELDIDGPTDNAQLLEYQRIFPLLWENPAVQGITLWGYWPGLWRNAEKAYLITDNGIERPALTWLRDYVANKVTGIKYEEIAGLNIYPNPALTKKISITGLERNSIIKLHDAMGKLVQETKVKKPNALEIDLNVVPGMYLMHLVSGKKQSFRKIVVQ